jgi:hypothetical protein
MFRSSPAVFFFVTALACSPGTKTDDAPEPSHETTDDPLLLVGDVEHLLDRALAERDVGDRVAAGRTVDQAYLHFRRGIRPRYTDADSEVVLEAEYNFGLLSRAVRTRGGNPRVHLVPIRAALSLARERVGPPPPP